MIRDQSIQCFNRTAHLFALLKYTSAHYCHFERTPLVLVGQPVGRQFDLIPAYDKCLKVEGISLTDTQRIFDRLL